MSRSIIPKGFEATAHSVFWEFVKPPAELTVEDSPDVAIHEQDKSLDDIDAHNRCPICLSSYTSPITLVSCLHSYCMECLLLWYAKKIECPLCKTSGRLFVRSDELSICKDIRVFSIDSVDVSESFHLIRRAIHIHSRRFAPPPPTAVDIKRKSISAESSPEYRSESSKMISEQKRPRLTKPVDELSPVCVSTELSEVRDGLCHAVALLRNIDKKISQHTYIDVVDK